MLAEDIHFCPRCATKLISENRFGHERPVCPACQWVFFPDPKVAVAVLVKQGGKVLLVRRANTPEQGKWSLPAGFLDAGEDPRQAAARECREETGLQVQVTQLLDVIAAQEHTRGAHLFIVYRAEISGGILTAGDDADQVDFFAPDNLPPLAFKTTSTILSRFR